MRHLTLLASAWGGLCWCSGVALGSPLEDHGAPHAAAYPLLIALTAIVSLSVLLLACAACRRKNHNLASDSSQATITTPPINHEENPLRKTGSHYEDVEHVMDPRPADRPTSDNPFLRGSEPIRQAANDSEDLYTKPSKERSQSTSSPAAAAAVGTTAERTPEPEVMYSDAVSVSRSGTGVAATMVPPRQHSQSQSDRPLQYAVLDFHKDKQAGSPQPPPLPPPPVSPTATTPTPPPPPPPPQREETSQLAKTLSQEARDDVYGNAASILTSTIVPRTAVELGSRIDGGQFGDVFRGTMTRNSDAVDVAVKAVRLDTSENAEARRAFLEETATMAQLQHPNVVQLLAIVEDPLWLIMEFVKEGSVLAYIRAHPPLPLPVLLQIATNTASGLKYLHDHRVIHRDIAARNVLLQGSKGNFMAKVGDLGMARVGDHYKGAAETPLPIRWCALESIYYGTFTRATDVWAFGVFLWELASSGQFPYPDYTSDAELVAATDKGVRLPQPHGSANELYSLMCSCWIANAETRPSMASVLESLSRLQRGLSAFNPNTDMGEYQMVDGAPTSDLILFTRFLSPPTTEYRQVPDAPTAGLYIRIETFDGSVFRPAREGLAGQAYEAAVVRSRMVFAPLLVDELRPTGPLYVLRDKGSAHAQLNRRRHLTRAAVETTHADPDVYTLVQKNTATTGRSRVHTISTSSDDHGAANGSPSHDARLRAGSQSEDPSATMARRRVQSNATALTPQGPPLPARAPTRPTSVVDTATLTRSQSSRSGSVGQVPVQAGPPLSGARHPDADQLTAVEWQCVEAWLARTVSRTQAEQFLMNSDVLGSYLVRRSERTATECALSVRGSRNVQHYKLLLLDDGQVAMVDVTNGNKKFVSLQSLISFYKLLEPRAIGGLCARLSVCLQPN